MGELEVENGIVRELAEDETLGDGDALQNVETPETVLHPETTKRDNIPRGARREVNPIARCRAHPSSTPMSLGLLRPRSSGAFVAATRGRVACGPL